MEVKLQAFLNMALDGEGGQLHIPAAMSLEKEILALTG
jgi:hypothetical protein